VHGGLHDVEPAAHLVYHGLLGQAEQLGFVRQRRASERPSPRLGECQHFGAALKQLAATLDVGNGRRLAKRHLRTERRQRRPCRAVEGGQPPRVDHHAPALRDAFGLAGELAVRGEQRDDAVGSRGGSHNQRLPRVPGETGRPAVHLDHLDGAAADGTGCRREAAPVGGAQHDLDGVGMSGLRERRTSESDLETGLRRTAERRRETVVGQVPAHQRVAKARSTPCCQ